MEERQPPSYKGRAVKTSAVLCEHLQFLEERITMEYLVEHLTLKLRLLHTRERDKLDGRPRVQN